MVLGKEFPKKILFFCRVPPGRALGKEFPKKVISFPSASRKITRQRISKKNYFFAECLQGDTRQRIPQYFFSLPSALPGSPRKVIAECATKGTRQILLPTKILSRALCRVRHSAKALSSAKHVFPIVLVLFVNTTTIH